jgi:hypothetical protein
MCNTSCYLFSPSPKGMLDTNLLKVEGSMKSVDCSEKGVRGEGHEGPDCAGTTWPFPTASLAALENEVTESRKYLEKCGL